MALTFFPFDIYSCLLDSAMNELSRVNATLLDSPCTGIRALLSLDLVGSCNGLICISARTLNNKYLMILWNPSIKKWRKLPQIDAPPFGVIHGFGFGYDELNDDYKLVQIFSSGYSILAVRVYSMRTNSWRSIKVNGLFFPARVGNGMFSNGALHWLGKQFGGLWSISSFDLANQTFRNIDVPNPEDTGARWNLGVLGGCLCLYCSDHYQNMLDLWILENGAKESWTKLVSISYSINPGGPISPLFVSQNGEVLLKFGPKFMLYNKKHKTFYYPDIWMGRRTRRFNEGEACVYVESLVSPHTGGEGWS